MENSIEEDIILLKDFTEGNFKRDKLENYKGSYKMGYFYYKDIQQAIEHILSDYKRVLKENKTLKNFMGDLFDDENIIENDYVLKDDIRDAMKKYEWATKSYDCDEADYKQSQDIGAWFALLNLINKKGGQKTMRNKLIEKIFEEKLPQWKELEEVKEYIENLEEVDEEHRKINGELRKKIAMLEKN